MTIESIAKTLGAGSGIDINSLVDQLITTEYQVKNDQMTAQQTTLTAQISSVSDLKSGITGFDSALKSLISGGTLSTQPTSSNTNVLTVSKLAGAQVSGLSSTVEVRQLASAEVATTGVIADKTASVGTGTLTLTFGTATVSADGSTMTGFTAGAVAPVNIAIASANSTPQGIADAINNSKAGVTASVLSDADGVRLVVKSATGASQAFTLTATEDAGAPGLSSLNIGPGATGTTLTGTPQDAIVAVDGVPVRRASNTILDLVKGVQLNLVNAAVGTKVTIGTVPPTSALGQAVGDFVDTYNSLLATIAKATDPVSGDLKSDSGAQSLQHSLAQLTLANLVPGGAAGTPKTLAELGVATNRDGTLSVNSNQLAAAISNYPGSVESMFGAGAGLSAQLSDIADAATNTLYGLGASAAKYTKAQSDLTDEQAKVASDSDAERTRMTAQFANMDSIVASYKSTQAFLTQQIAAWNASSN